MSAEKTDKPTCFVIQAFDGGKYDRRYRETIRPALEKAGVEPQRADEILGLNPVIEKIESAIEAASPEFNSYRRNYLILLEAVLKIATTAR